MKDVSKLTVCFADHGIFLPLALKLGERFKRVLYHTPWEQSFPTVNDCIIGDGFEQIERCDDIWKVKSEVDLFLFPDIMHGGLQLELESQGFPVWGSRRADTLEMNREKFHNLLDGLKMDVPSYVVKVGTTALAEHLKTAEDKVIKVSKFRGSIETCKWRNWAVDQNMVDAWAVQFGQAKELIRFLVFDVIDTDIELGCDTFNIRGQWPKRMIQGYEAKDSGFLSSVRDRDEMPPQVQEVLEKFGPILEGFRYANSFSMEIRVKGDKSYFIDPCTRWPMPPTGSKTELWGNLAEVIAAGAEGVLEEPQETEPFAAELAVKLCGDKKEWRCTEVPCELRQWLKFSNCCQIDGRICFPPLEFSEDKVGWLVAIGSTIDETVQTLLERVEALPPGLTADVSPLAELLEQIHSAEAQGIEFSEDKVPPPESVLA
jgi:hypothetical protein